MSVSPKTAPNVGHFYATAHRHDPQPDPPSSCRVGYRFEPHQITDSHDRCRTRTTPTKMQMMAGQKVIPQRMPGPIGLGLGSGHNPTAAATMIKNKGPEPIKSVISPALTQYDLKYRDIIGLRDSHRMQLDGGNVRVAPSRIIWFQQRSNLTSVRNFSSAPQPCSSPTISYPLSTPGAPGT